MERNAHRLTLHSPARESLRQTHQRDIDIDQLFCAFRAFNHAIEFL